MACLWLMLIRIADKTRWRGLEICDISPSASATSRLFRATCLESLNLLAAADPSAIDTITQNVRYIAHAYPLRGICSYNYVARLFLVNWTDLKKEIEGEEFLEEFGILLFKSAVTGRLYNETPSLFGSSDRESVIEITCTREGELLRQKIAPLLRK